MSSKIPNIIDDWQQALAKNAGDFYAAIISDSHFQGGKTPDIIDILRQLQPQVIIHCGDLCGLDFWWQLRSIAEVYAVAGNCDDAMTAKNLGKSRLFQLQDLKIGVTHGDWGSGKNRKSPLRRSFAAEKPDLICFGHSHQPYEEAVGGSRLYNPGSCARPRGFAPAPSFGWLRIAGGSYDLHTFFTKKVDITQN